MSDTPWKGEPVWLRRLAEDVVRVPPAISTEPRLRVQKSFPKSKRRRVRKKWGKRNENYKVDRNIYQFAGRYLCHPSVALELRNLLRSQGHTMMEEVTT